MAPPMDRRTSAIALNTVNLRTLPAQCAGSGLPLHGRSLGRCPLAGRGNRVGDGEQSAVRIDGEFSAQAPGAKAPATPPSRSPEWPAGRGPSGSLGVDPARERRERRRLDLRRPRRARAPGWKVCTCSLMFPVYGWQPGPATGDMRRWDPRSLGDCGPCRCRHFANFSGSFLCPGWSVPRGQLVLSASGGRPGRRPPVSGSRVCVSRPCFFQGQGRPSRLPTADTRPRVPWQGWERGAVWTRATNQ